MATLNLSQNGPSIKSSYEKIANAPPPSGPAASSPTYGQWAVYAVSAPLVSAFQNEAGKESVLKVQSTGEGELEDLVDEFSEGRIQFAFVKVKDPNSGLPKNVLIAWCGEGVPERTKGYFGSHLEAVSKLLHGYHVQVTARSEAMLTPEGIVEKVANASGAKYTGGGSLPTRPAGGPPQVASKPVFTPTRVGGAAGGFNPLGSRSRTVAAHDGPTDEDGWGADAPPVTRKQLEKVAPAYKPIGKVNLNELQSQREPSRFSAPSQDSNGGDVVKGAYQPIGKVDIAAIRRQAKETGGAPDDRPTAVKGAYEPVGKVDIAAIRARAQGPGAPSPSASLSPSATGASNRSGEEEAPRSLTDRSSAFQQSERLTSLPKPKVANKFGGASSFTGTKAPTPGGFGAASVPAAAPVGAASRTFADQGGKTPAQLWAEKKAMERGLSASGGAPGITSPVKSQSSGEGGWKSGYSGKSWAPVQTTHTGRSASSNLSAQRTGQEEEATPASPAGGISSIRDRFSGAPPPPMDLSSKPNAGAARGVPIPGLPTRPSADEVPSEEHVNVPPPPAQPRSPSPEPEMRPSSPIRIAQPIARTAQPELEAAHEPPSIPTEAIAKAASASRDVTSEPQVADEDPARSAATAAATSTFGAAATTAAPSTGGGIRAVIQYDYEKAEDNELELREGEMVTNIEMVDEDWWMGQNERGETGLFPSNYVEVIEDGSAAGGAAPPPAPARAATPEPPAAAPAPAGGAGPTATALYDYEPAEDNELGFPDGAKITSIEFPDDDWWFGSYGGKTGLFPANYVELDQ